MLSVQQAADRIAAMFVETWNRHDAKAFSSIFAPDADFTNVFGMKASGRAEVERFHAPLFATMFRDSRLSIENVSSRQIRSDVGTVDLRWSMSGAYDPRGNAWPDRIGLISLVIATRGGKWLVECMHNMELDDAASAGAQQELQRANTA
jgi:uncharacterized protein (TIGR02246 family)